MKTFAHYPHQKTIVVFEKRREIESYKYQSDKEKKEIADKLKERKIKQKNYFEFID